MIEPDHCSSQRDISTGGNVGRRLRCLPSALSNAKNFVLGGLAVRRIQTGHRRISWLQRPAFQPSLHSRYF